MEQKSHFLGCKEQKKAGACRRFPLRYYKDNTSAGEMQIAFNFLLQFVAPFLRIGGRFRKKGRQPQTANRLFLRIRGWLLKKGRQPPMAIRLFLRMGRMFRFFLCLSVGTSGVLSGICSLWLSILRWHGRMGCLHICLYIEGGLFFVRGQMV